MALVDSWAPQGGVTIAYCGGSKQPPHAREWARTHNRGLLWAQAMVRGGSVEIVALDAEMSDERMLELLRASIYDED